MNNLTLIKSDGEFYADSRDVAEAIDRGHKDLLRTIRTYCEYLGQSKIAQSDFFVEATYINEQNKEMPCYFITKKGCDMIANKLTGKKGVLFTAAYVSAFEKMQEQIQLAYNETKLYPAKATSAGEVSSLIKNVRIVMERQKSAPVKIASQTEVILKHFGIPVIENFVEKDLFRQTTVDEIRDYYADLAD